jgi:hypothetical protein
MRAYLCSAEPNSRCEVLVNVPLIGGQFPPIIEWRGVLYYWKFPSGGYYRGASKENVVELSEADVVAVVDHPPRPTDKSVA